MFSNVSPLKYYLLLHLCTTFWISRQNTGKTSPVWISFVRLLPAPVTAYTTLFTFMMSKHTLLIMVQIYKFAMSTFSMLTIHSSDSTAASFAFLDTVTVKTSIIFTENLFIHSHGDIRMLSYPPHVRQILVHKTLWIAGGI